jgi:hypothetical protein
MRTFQYGLSVSRSRNLKLCIPPGQFRRVVPHFSIEDCGKMFNFAHNQGLKIREIALGVPEFPNATWALGI